jgi:hypothetical protein
MLPTDSLFHGVVQENYLKKTGSSFNGTITSKVTNVSMIVHIVACTAVTMRRSRNRHVSRQRLGKHVSAATNRRATIEELCWKRGAVRKKIGATKPVLYGSLRREDLGA